MTIESIAKYDLKHVNQCELNENIGFNMDKALRFVEFQSPDIIYLEGIKTREAFEFLSELYYNDKTVVTEFMANNMTDLRQKLAYDDFQSFKSLITCLVFIHSRDSIEVFDKTDCIDYLVNEGNAYIEVVREDEIVKKVISNLIFTLRDLELQYPKYIKINEKI